MLHYIGYEISRFFFHCVISRVFFQLPRKLFFNHEISNSSSSKILPKNGGWWF